MATQSEKIAALFAEIKTVAAEKKLSEYDIKDCLMLALKAIYRQTVFITERQGLLMADGTPLPVKSVKKIERRIVYEIGKRAAQNKYNDISQKLKASNNVITAKVISYTKNTAVVSWEDMLFMLPGENFYFLKNRPKSGDMVILFVVAKKLDMENIDRPIELTLTTRNKKYLQRYIANQIGTDEFIVEHIDIKKIFLRFQIPVTPEINEKLILSPFRVYLNRVER